MSPVNPILRARLERGQHNPLALPVKREHEIFDGTDYPATWDGFIGQDEAVEQLVVCVASAQRRNTRLDHTLLASGMHGVGKTTLAQIIAYEMGSGYVSVSGPLTGPDFAKAVGGCQDADIIFWDEFHLAVAGNKARADWLLPFMTDGVLLSRDGVQELPGVTLIAATTDAGKLPLTVTSRFMVRPTLTAYSAEEGAQICDKLATRMSIELTPREQFCILIARAADNNPRAMRVILTAVRDLATMGPVSIEKAFKWAGVCADGLTHNATDYLLVLLGSKDYTASLETIQAALSEPGPLRHVEQMLIQRGYITITGRGRVLTEDGVIRALEAV